MKRRPRGSDQRPRESERDAAKRIVMMRRAQFIAAAIASSGMATACACLKVKPDVDVDAGGGLDPKGAAADASAPSAGETDAGGAEPPPAEDGSIPVPCLKVAPTGSTPLSPVGKPDAGAPRADAGTPPRPCLSPPPRPCLKPPNRNNDPW